MIAVSVFPKEQTGVERSVNLMLLSRYCCVYTPSDYYEHEQESYKEETKSVTRFV